MQSLLRDFGGAGANQPVDGRLGKDTDAAIRAFQAASGLKVDGIAGPHTKSALEAAKLVVEAHQALQTGSAEAKAQAAQRLQQADALLRNIPAGQGGPAWAALKPLAQAAGLNLAPAPGEDPPSAAPTNEGLGASPAAPSPYPSAPPGSTPLGQISEAELKRLGQTDKKAFLEALRPAAEENERRTGVPAAVTLAQAALETGWGKKIIPGFNLFGIKGSGPAGSIRVPTTEVYGGRKVHITDNFAQYHNFTEAMAAHSKVLLNGRYNKALNAYARNKDPHEFGRLITGIYATDPQYHQKLSSIMRKYGLA